MQNIVGEFGTASIEEINNGDGKLQFLVSFEGKFMEVCGSEAEAIGLAGILVSQYPVENGSSPETASQDEEPNPVSNDNLKKTR